MQKNKKTRIFDTLTCKKKNINHKTKKIKLYVCGPTLYGPFHLGHARTYLVFDVLAKWLKNKGYNTEFLMNLTDIDDRIISQSIERGMSLKEIAKEHEKEFFDGMKKLGIDSITYFPKVTENIKEIKKQIIFFIKNKYAYITGNGIYFNLSRFPSYGELTKKNLDKLKRSRIKENHFKKRSEDFCIWKTEKVKEARWKLKFNFDLKKRKLEDFTGKEGDKFIKIRNGKVYIDIVGRPGWHVEDTAILEKYFNGKYTIHGGGGDLAFPHHECVKALLEILNKCSSCVDIWIHTGYLTVEKRRMSFQKKTLLTLDNLLSFTNKETIRTFFLMSHYSKPINFDEKKLKNAEKSLKRFYKAVRDFNQLKKVKQKVNNTNLHKSLNIFKKEFEDSLDDDLNTAKALGSFFKFRAVLKEYSRKENKVNDRLKKEINKTIKNYGKTLGIIEDSSEIFDREEIQIIKQFKKPRCVKLFNTMGRKKFLFKPMNENKVLMYSCGPTVYTTAHIGNLRSFLFADLVKKTLSLAGYKVKHIMNITDVGHLTDDADAGEDKMEKSSQEKDKTTWEIAKYYTKIFKKDLRRLNIEFPIKFTKATEYIPQMINLVQKLIKKGFTYQTSDGIYFDTAKIKKYSQLAKLDIKGLQEGKRVKMEEKKHKTDFALWKFTPQGQKRQMEWKAFDKIGFPGWHIECSAMAITELGKTIDIHTGGVDHIPVHHTNEIAQSEAATGKKFSHFWMHGDFLIPEKGGKMSKSQGNFVTISELMDKGCSPLAYRYFLLQSHYRKKIKFSNKVMKASQKGLDNLKSLIADFNQKKFGKSQALQYKKEIEGSLFNDINTPQAMALLWSLVKDAQIGDRYKKELIIYFDQVLSLDLLISPKKKLKIPEAIIKLAEKRNLAREKKSWQEADKLREKIEKKGFSIEDNADDTFTLNKK